MDDLDNSAIYVAGAYSLNKSADSTVAWLDRAYALRSDVIGFVQYPLFDWLRNDPRFIALRNKHNIPAVTR